MINTQTSMSPYDEAQSEVKSKLAKKELDLQNRLAGNTAYNDSVEAAKSKPSPIESILGGALQMGLSAAVPGVGGMLGGVLGNIFSPKKKGKEEGKGLLSIVGNSLGEDSLA